MFALAQYILLDEYSPSLVKKNLNLITYLNPEDVISKYFQTSLQLMMAK